VDANDNKKQSLIQRIVSMETAISLTGLFFIGSAFYTGDQLQYFWGGMIICGSIALHFVRKKDWKKHWEEQEALQRRYEARRKIEQEDKDRE